jgi:hypothetical protein
MNITTLTPQQLREAADLKERMDALQERLSAILGGAEMPIPVPTESPETPRNGRRKRRRKKISAEGRANISAAQKARWAAMRGEAPSEEAPATQVRKPRRKGSAAWRKALSAAMKRRWAKARRAGKSSL